MNQIAHHNHTNEDQEKLTEAMANVKKHSFQMQLWLDKGTTIVCRLFVFSFSHSIWHPFLAIHFQFILNDNSSH